MKKVFPLSAFAFAILLSGYANAGMTPTPSPTPSPSTSSGITVDGNLSDWQIDKGTFASSLPGVRSTVEDTTGNQNTYLNPGYGGQAYDAEALYSVMQDGKLYIALITGHNPLTPNNPGANSYGAGDFAISFGKNGVYDLGINVGPGFGVAGGVYSNPSWAYGIWDVAGNQTSTNPDMTHPTSLTGGTKIGDAELSFTTVGEKGYGSWVNDLHYFYEIAIDTSLLELAGWDGSSSFDIHWTENCANDNIMTDVNVSSSSSTSGSAVPEPGSLALLGIGMLGVLGGGTRRRLFRKAK